MATTNFRILAPRPSESTAFPNTTVVNPSAVPRPQGHSESEWAAVYPHIERLYVRQRRKLRYVMKYMEEEHGFEASQQMYKKRFAKWGFHKNARRASPNTAESTGSESNRNGQVSTLLVNSKAKSRHGGLTSSEGNFGKLNDFPPMLQLSSSDTVALRFMTSIRAWSSAYFEPFGRNTGGAWVNQPLVYPAKEGPCPSRMERTGHTFKIVIDLIRQGQGLLAGRTARKAFLMVEDILLMDGPIFLWNLLDLMYSMLLDCQPELFQLLLDYLIGLSRGRYQETHPIVQMLEGLRAITASSDAISRFKPAEESVTIDSSNSTSNSQRTGQSNSQSKSHSKPHRNNLSQGDSHSAKYRNTSQPSVLDGTLASLLKQGWSLNAEILFANFGSRFLLLYYSLVWDSCTIKLPSAIMRNADDWFGLLDSTPAPRMVSTPTDSEDEDEDQDAAPYLQDLGPRAPAAPGLPANYEEVRRASIAAMRERGSRGLDHEADPATSMRVFAGLLKSKIPASVEGGEDGLSRAAGFGHHGAAGYYVPRLHAQIVAYVTKLLVDMGLDRGDDEAADTAVERTRNVIALRRYAQGEADPMVVREMWLLADLLDRMGDTVEAAQVRADAHRRLEMFLEDIPVNSL